MSLPHQRPPVESLSELSRFRTDLHACLTGRRDALFEVCEALVCAPGPVHHLAQLSLEPEHHRGHGSAYAALNHGRLDTDRLRQSLTAPPPPRFHGRLVLACDVSPWLRPDAWTSPDRSWCHTYGRGTGQAEMVPGWPYSMIAALEEGSTSWTAPLDLLRLLPGQDPITATADQVRGLLQRLIAAGHHRPADPDVLVVVDAGYDAVRLAFLLAGLPVQVLGRLRSDRVLYGPAEHLPPSAAGRPAKHGAPLRMAAPATWPAPEQETSTATRRYGTATARAWNRMHPRLTHRSAWADHPGELPVIEGTLVRLEVEALPSRRSPAPLWLWSSATGLGAEGVDGLWWAYLRRFDIEHTFRFLKQQLGWDAPRLRDPEAADRWSWIVIAAYTQLRLARRSVGDVRLPWQRRVEQHRLSPGRVRRGFRYLRAGLPGLVGVPRPSRPGPGRPPGSRNRCPAPRYGVARKNKKNKTGTASRPADKQPA
ncbi:hypothetical protein SUDANB121_04984 [Nocardiopsis dassonvillei]|uniref:NF041680 family putative transposase n=1 Tax=Nocardiopsis dassonvillei TaxID=2014 RepID=UPI003F572FE5